MGMVICVAVDCKSDSKQGKAFLSFYKFPRNEILKQQLLIKIKRRNIQSIKHARMCHAYCFG